MIWSKNEVLNRNEMEALQLIRMKETIKRVYNNVPFYKKRLDDVGLTPEKFNNLKDLQYVPFTTKEDLRLHYPYGLFAADMKDIVRLHASSGTTGKPTVVGYTKNDLNMWSDCVARLICAGGGRKEDIAQIAFGYGMFTGAFGLHYGLERLGATVVPVSSGNTEKQLMFMKDFKTTTLISTPSYALYMAEVMADSGMSKDDLSLRIGLFGGEGSTEEMRMEIENRWGIIATENYGLSEIIGPGVSGECTYKNGMHINEDHFYPEIIDPEKENVLGDEINGEIVFTTLTKEAFPLLRYRTKDITSLHKETCQCGRKSVRMSKIKGRSDDMLIIKGVNVFPSQIEGVLLSIDKIGPHYQIIVSKKGYTDFLEVVAELADDSLLESFKGLEDLRSTIKHKLFTVLGLDVKVTLANPKSLERFTGKAKRVFDNR